MLPSAAIWVLESKAQAAVRSSVGRIRRRAPRAELYVAFDDPYSALALETVRDLRSAPHVDFEIYPVVRRGVAGDSNSELRRAYSLRDAKRLATRRGRPIVRDELISPERVAELAYWTEAAREQGRHEELCVALLERLWFRGKSLPDFGELYALYRQIVGSNPPKNLLRYRLQVRKNETRLLRRGHWDSPSLLLEGKWYFAHERGEQIRQQLEELS